MKVKIHIGTSGFYYNHWIGKFYPEKLKQRGFFEYYLKFFKTLELNSPFYRLPASATFESWKKKVPDDFIFAVKASRYITHIKKLKDTKESVNNFFERVDKLEEKLGVVLFQLPPSLKYNYERIEEFLKILPKGYRMTFEFRNHSWYNEELYDLLAKYNHSFCIYELEYHFSPMVSTADFVYVRLHGPETKYSGSYSENTLQLWADKAKNWQKQGKDVYIYFDNDQNAYAAFNAQSLLEMCQ